MLIAVVSFGSVPPQPADLSSVYICRSDFEPLTVLYEVDDPFVLGGGPPDGVLQPRPLKMFDRT